MVLYPQIIGKFTRLKLSSSLKRINPYKDGTADSVMLIVIGTETYQKELRKWTKADREAAEKLPKQLSINPFVGSPLGYPFLREKRIREKRVYYLVYEDLKLVLLVATSGKKDQQATIDDLKEHLDNFREIAEDIAMQVS